MVYSAFEAQPPKAPGFAGGYLLNKSLCFDWELNNFLSAVASQKRLTTPVANYCPTAEEPAEMGEVSYAAGDSGHTERQFDQSVKDNEQPRRHWDRRD